MTDPRSARWVFTINNYTDDTINSLNTLFADTTRGVSYLIYGRETADTGTPHLQGYIVLKTRVRRSTITRLLGGHCFVEIAKGNNKQASDYCKKQHDWTVWGDLPSDKVTQGKRSDMDKFMQDVLEGNRNKKALRLTHPMIAAKFPKFFNDFIQDHTPVNKVPDKTLRVWQAEMCTLLQGDPGNRTINFVVDTIGNAGKSWFAHWYRTTFPCVQVIVPGKKTDMAYILMQEPKVIFFDCPRSKTEQLQYDFLEECKNGYVFSGKYESVLREFKSPHIMVLMNEEPDMTKLSGDRYYVRNLSPSDNEPSAFTVDNTQEDLVDG